MRVAPSATGARGRPRWLRTIALSLGLLTGCASAPRTEPTRARTPAPTSSAAKQTAHGDDAGPVLVLRGARVMTATGVIYDAADVVIRGKSIAAVGVGLPVPTGAAVLELKGRTITPGLVDTHSHLGVYPAPSWEGNSDGNEAVAPTTAQVRAADAYWPQDPQIDRARAGGVTTMQILPGSANLIGGRAVTVKTYLDVRGIEDARFRGAPEGLKMACGENPKRVYGEKGGPSTRMGNVAGYRTAFQKAREYRRSWESYRDKIAKWTTKRAAGTVDDEARGKDDGPPDPPARDLAAETLASVLEGDILVHNHCYRADEMLGMLALADEFGFQIRSFHHAVEAYKIADHLASAGVAASVWADWWGFKAEALDGIRENAAMVAAAGGRAIIHSDSALGIQRLAQEASKAMWAGRRVGLGITDDEALRWITANPAWALGVEDRIGTIAPGKHADLAIWDGDPFSVYSRVVHVFIEGRLVYDHAEPIPGTDFELGYVEGSR